MVSRAMLLSTYRGARITRNADDLIQTGVVTNVRHYVILRDTDGFFNGDPQYQGCFFIPAGVRRVRCSACLQWGTNGIAGERWQDIIHNNGVTVPQVACDRRAAVTSAEATIVTGVLEVKQNDILTHRAYQTTGFALGQNFVGNSISFFDLEVID